MSSSRREFLKTSFLTVGLLSLLGYAGRAFAFTTPKKTFPSWNRVTKDSVVTCPACRTKVKQTMSSESVKRVYHCPGCLTWLSPKKGHHCIYDSYGSVSCPAIQITVRRANNLPI